jgi:hypothetical protein
MSRWYWWRDGVRAGPFAPAQLRQQAESGQLRPADLVWKEGHGRWVRADSVRGLFQAAPPRAPVRYNPAEFKELYDRVLRLSIPVAILGATAELLPAGVNVVAQLSSLVLLIVVSNMLLYKAWAQIQDGLARTTPGQAVGLRFIPFFHFYWEFVAVKGLAEDLNAYARRKGIPAAPVSTDLALWCCILMIVGEVMGCVPLVGWLFGLPQVVVSLILLHQVKEASMAIAAAPRQGPPPLPFTGFPVLDAVARGLDFVGELAGPGGDKGSDPGPAA